MYSEQINVAFRGGLHGESLNAIGTHFPPGMVTINGVDVTDMRQRDPLYDLQQVNLSVNTGDPTTDKDVFDIVHGIANFGYDPWRGRGLLPAQFYAQAAEWMRNNPEFGLQGGMQATAGWGQDDPQMQVGQDPPCVLVESFGFRGEMSVEDWADLYIQEPDEVRGIADRMLADKSEPYPWNEYEPPKYYTEFTITNPREFVRQVGQYITGFDDRMELFRQALQAQQQGVQTQPSVPLSGEMTTGKLAMWSVVALGELQQPGGVGAMQEEYNPVLDGPNPEGPNFEDNAQNSQEQEVALQTWVNHAVNMLNRGDEPEVVMAQLAHDGCPEPEAVLKRALEQPERDEMDQPITDQIGQDPFEAPMPDDGQSGQMQDVSRQPPVVQAKRVRIANSTMTGVELDRWEDMWGQGTVKIALDEGGTMNVSPGAVEEITDETPEHPVSQIQQFIDSLPKVEPTRPHIQARIDNLELVRRAVRSTISKVGFSDQVKLTKMDTDAQDEIMALKESLGATISESDVAYLSGQQTYRPQGLDLPGVERVSVADPDFQKKIAEKAAIFVAELPFETITDSESVAYAAMRYASERNGNVAEFMRLAEENRVVRMEEFSPVEEMTSEMSDNEGPAEGIYL